MEEVKLSQWDSSSPRYRLIWYLEPKKNRSIPLSSLVALAHLEQVLQ